MFPWILWIIKQHRNSCYSVSKRIAGFKAPLSPTLRQCDELIKMPTRRQERDLHSLFTGPLHVVTTTQHHKGLWDYLAAWKGRLEEFVAVLAVGGNVCGPNKRNTHARPTAASLVFCHTMTILMWPGWHKASSEHMAIQNLLTNHRKKLFMASLSFWGQNANSSVWSSFQSLWLCTSGRKVTDAVYLLWRCLGNIVYKDLVCH